MKPPVVPVAATEGEKKVELHQARSGPCDLTAGRNMTSRYRISLHFADVSVR